MCWIKPENQSPRDGTEVDIWVDYKGDEFRVPMLKFVEGAYRYFDQRTGEVGCGIPLSNTKVLYWREAPVRPEVQNG